MEVAERRQLKGQYINIDRSMDIPVVVNILLSVFGEDSEELCEALADEIHRRKLLNEQDLRVRLIRERVYRTE